MKQELLAGPVEADVFPALCTLIFYLLAAANATLAYIAVTY